jgi:hypothetical protein
MFILEDKEAIALTRKSSFTFTYTNLYMKKSEKRKVFLNFGGIYGVC